MKNIVFVLFALIISASAFASNDETIMICQQEDQSSTWIEIKITLNITKGLRALVFEHNNQKAQPKLLTNTPVFSSVEIGTTLVKDSDKKFDLRIFKYKSQFRGNLVLLQDGPDPIKASNLLCIK